MTSWVITSGRNFCEALGEVRVGEQRSPVGTAIGVVFKLPEMDELIDHAGITLEIADEVFVVPTLLDRGVAELLIQLDRFRHLRTASRS